MTDYEEFIASGILELYVLGDTTTEEEEEVKEMIALFPQLTQEILEISTVYEKLALENTVEPDPIIKPFLLATIDYMARLGKGEPFVVAPELSASSTIAAYQEFIDREDMVAPEDFDDIYAKIISAIPNQLTTAIVWLREMAPQETHDDEYERFLILEGTCTITIEEESHYLARGSYLQIPLHKKHHVTVTSVIPCKILLQRVKVAA